MALLLQVAGDSEHQQRHQLDGEFRRRRPGRRRTGIEYFAAALYLANKRWGSAGATNYKLEADNIAGAMLHNTSTSDGRGPIIHASQNMPVFYPQGASGNFTDPSYHLPAFYELFAANGPSADATRWRTVASTSRGFYVTSANATTGLHPDYATFAGAPTTAAAGDGHNTFGYDAWRVVMNMAVDYVWGAADSREKTQIEKLQTFFNSYLANGNVTQCLFGVDGSSPSGGRIDRADRDAGGRRNGVDDVEPDDVRQQPLAHRPAVGPVPLLPGVRLPAGAPERRRQVQPELLKPMSARVCAAIAAIVAACACSHAEPAVSEVA